MDTIHITTREAILYSALINAAIGLVLGLIPLLFGYFQGRLKLGVSGIIFSTVGGAALGVFLSVPAVIVFTCLIWVSNFAKTVIGAVVSIVGIALAIFGVLRMNSVASEVVDANANLLNYAITYGFIIAGVFFAIMGAVILLTSIWPEPASSTGTSVPGQSEIESDSKN